MDRRVSIIPRLGRFRRNLAASLDNSGEHVSTAARRTSLTLRRLGRSLAASFDSGVGYMEDDPVGAFLNGKERKPEVGPDAATQAPAAADPDARLLEFDGQSPTVENPPPAESPSQSAPEPPPTSFETTPLEPDSQNADVLNPPPVDSSPQETPEPPLTSFEPLPSEPDSPLESSTEPPPAADFAAAGPLLDNEGEDAAQSHEQAAESTTIASFDTLSLEMNDPNTDAVDAPPADSPPQSTAELPPLGDLPAEASHDSEEGGSGLAQDDVMEMTAATNSEPLALDVDVQNTDLEPLPSEESSPGGSDADSLLDLFRSENIEENPVADLAKGLSDVDIYELLEKARRTAEQLKGEP